MNGKYLKTAELLSIVTTPGLLGDIETYFANTMEINVDSTLVDIITLKFMDKDRNYLRSLKEFMLVHFFFLWLNFYNIQEKLLNYITAASELYDIQYCG